MIMTSSNIFAHKVTIFAYVVGETVYTESYFSDGTKVKDGEIVVYDRQGNKLLEGKTDKDGLFNFKLPKKDELRIELNATMGHKASYILSFDEIPKEVIEKSEKANIKKTNEEKITQVNLKQIKNIIDDSLDEKLKPVMQQLKKIEEKRISFTEILGGIGYILGLMGIIMYFLSKKKEG